MFKEIYQHDGNSNYLIMEGVREEYIGFADKILQENQVPGLLPLWYQYIDGKTYFYYKVNSLQSLSQVFERRKINREELFHILLEIDKNWRELESYLLPQEKIVLHPEYIFTDFDLEKVYFCYCPDYEEVVSYEKLAAFFVEVVDYKDNRAVEIAYGFHGQVCEWNSSFSDAVSRLVSEQEKKEEPEKEAVLPMEEIKAVEKEEKNKKETYYDKFLRLPGKISLGGIIVLAVVLLLLWIGILELYQGILFLIITLLLFGYILWSQKKRDPSKDEDYEINLMEEGEIFRNNIQNFQVEPVGQTILLSRNLEGETPRLIYEGKDDIKSFDLDVFPFVLGKAGKGIDGTVTAPLVSRIHCQINYVNQEYTLQDLNSTNGTCLNGCLLTPRDKVKLQQGDRVMLANQPFVFR